MAARQPTTINLTLAANTRVSLPVSGKWLHVLSISVASCQVAFDHAVARVVYPGVGIEIGEGFTEVTFIEHLGGGCTIEAVVSDWQIVDSRNSGFAAQMAASLAAIDLDTTAINNGVGVSNGHLANIEVDTGAMAASLVTIDAATGAMVTDLATIETLLDVRDNPIDIIPTMIPATGAEVQIVTGAAINRVVNLHALDTNAGDVWLRLQTGVSNLIYSIPLHPGDSWHEDWSGDVFACSQNGTEGLCGYVTRI